MSEDTGNEGAGGEEASAQEIQEAKANGWADKDAWRGDPAEWIDARTFNQRSQQILPLVRATNKKLMEKVASLEGQLTPLAGELRATRASLNAIEEAREEDLAAAREAERKRVKEELAAASRDGDHAAVADLTEELTKLNATPAPAKDKANGTDSTDDDMTPIGPKSEVQRQLTDWFETNKDFVENDTARMLAESISLRLRQKGDKRMPKEHLDAVRVEVEERLGKPQGNGSRVSSGNGGGERRPGAGGEKGYADLPKEAKEVCEKQAKRLVGDGRAHKTIDSWRNSYAKQYWAQEAGR